MRTRIYVAEIELVMASKSGKLPLFEVIALYHAFESIHFVQEYKFKNSKSIRAFRFRITININI